MGIEQAYEDVKKHWQSYKQETKHHQLQLATGLTLPSANELQHHGALTLPDGEGCYFMLFETSLIGLRRAASGQFEV